MIAVTEPRLTKRQREAMRMLYRSANQRQSPHGIVTSGATALLDNQPWVNWRTAQALTDRGFARIEWSLDEFWNGDIYLAEKPAAGDQAERSEARNPTLGASPLPVEENE